MTAASDTKAILPERKTIAAGQLLIDGRWRDASDGATLATTDPTADTRSGTVQMRDNSPLHLATGDKADLRIGECFGVVLDNRPRGISGIE